MFGFEVLRALVGPDPWKLQCYRDRAQSLKAAGLSPRPWRLQRREADAGGRPDRVRGEDDGGGACQRARLCGCRAFGVVSQGFGV